MCSLLGRGVGAAVRSSSGVDCSSGGLCALGQMTKQLVDGRVIWNRQVAVFYIDGETTRSTRC